MSRYPHAVAHLHGAARERAARLFVALADADIEPLAIDRPVIRPLVIRPLVTRNFRA